MFQKRKNFFSQSNQSKHYNDIKEGESVWVDGKKFTKIKIEFVDTYNLDTTKRIEKLESEIEFLNGKIEILNQRIEYYRNTFSQINTYIGNLHAEKQIDKAEYKSKIRQLNTEMLDVRNEAKAQIKELKGKLNVMIATHQSQIDSIETKKNKTIIALKTQIQILMNKAAENKLKKNKSNTLSPRITIQNKRNKDEVSTLISELKEKISWQKKAIKSKDVKIRHNELIIDQLNKKLLNLMLKDSSIESIKEDVEGS